jgi:Flp pilus assembly pilin Flp
MNQEVIQPARSPVRHPGMMRGRKGQGLIEYALVIILLAIACIGGITVFRNSLAQNFNFVSSNLSASLSGGS